MKKYETQKLQEQLRANNREIVNKEEYAALCALRDGVHEDLKVKHLQLQNRYQDVVAVNGEQLNRLTKMMLETDHIRASLTRIEDRDRLLTARVAKLEVELAEARKNADEAKKNAEECTRMKKALEEANMRLQMSYPTVPK